MSGFGITPPWYGDDEMAFNLYAISSESRKDALRELGMAIRCDPDKTSGSLQNALCEKILGCTLDDLSDAEFNYVSKVVNYEI